MHPEDESDGRVRRKTALPARYADYDLTGFAQPTLTTEPMSPHTQIPSHLSDDENQEEGATAYDLPLITVDELHSSDEGSTSDSGRSETALLKQTNRNLHYENDNMLHTVQVMQKERDALQLTNQHYAQELSQLKWQMQQLQIQVSQTQSVVQPQPPLTTPIPAPRRIRNIQPTEGVLKQMPAPRIRRDNFSGQQPFPAYTAAPRDQMCIPYDTTSIPASSQVDKPFHHGHDYPPYDMKYAASTPYDSAQYHQLPYSSQRKVPQLEPESVYRGPTPTIPDFIHPNPREFSRLKIALDNILPANATERFKFQILTDHLKLEEALLIADSYSHSQYPFTRTMAALDQQYGQPHQLALQRIAELMDGPNISSGDIKAFRLFALKVRSLVGMLGQLGAKGTFELQCGSHVSRLLGKLPHDLRSSFRRFAHPHSVPIPTLMDLSEWLEYEIQVQEDMSRFVTSTRRGPSAHTREVIREHKPTYKNANILLNTENTPSDTYETANASKAASPKPYCPYCDHTKHSLNNCANFRQLTTGQKRKWIKENNRCWRCGRSHQATECSLKMRCKQCSNRHLLVLHDTTVKSAESSQTVQTTAAPIPTSNSCLLNTMNEILLIRKPPASRKVLLKISKVILRNGKHHMTAYAIQDDGSERTILLHSAAQQLGLKGKPEDLPLRTVRQELQVLSGQAVSFSISPMAQPKKLFHIKGAFTAQQLSLAEHTHPIRALREKYRHLRGLPLQNLETVSPVLLIGSDYPHLITPVEPVRLGPPGGPAAVKTRLGWTLQGPVQHLQQGTNEQHCYFTTMASPETELCKHVEKLWQMDVLPWQSDKASTRSKLDCEAIKLLDSKTVRVEVDGVKRYATPLLRVKTMPQLKATKQAVLPQLRATEKRLKNPEQAAAYTAEIHKLEQANYAVKLDQQAEESSDQAWYIPHHMVHHNGKNRVVFNCSFNYQGQNLNDLLLPGPVLGPSLLAVLLRFREHSIAVSSDIRGMFHQIRLLPEDRPLLRFLWRDLKAQEPPRVFEWQVLPFGTTCSPCCAVYALQKHVLDNSEPEDDIRHSVMKSFYVDNCLQSFTTTEEAQSFVNKIQTLLADGGFELRQWSSNQPLTISHLPSELKSASTELWISQGITDTQESALGLVWNHQSDTISYKYRPTESAEITMRNIYRTLASQYDPLGYLIPYTTRAKLIVQRLWDKKRDWDDSNLPPDLLHTWKEWEAELPSLLHIRLPRSYTSLAKDKETSKRDIHVFCDASERAYGSVAYLRTEDQQGDVEVSFLTARSKVAPKKQQSIPRLELCAALTGAQLAKVVTTELTLPIHHITLWTDSTTVLTWLKSESCRFKVFVGTRVAEIQDLTDQYTWRFVPSVCNPADDITRGQTLNNLGPDSHWYQGPSFLKDSPSSWPETPAPVEENGDELRKTGLSTLACFMGSTALPNIDHYKTFQDLIEFTASHGAAADSLTASTYKDAEVSLLQQCQQESFPLDSEQLKAGKPLAHNSRLKALAPELDSKTLLIKVGGRLRHSSHIEQETIHPIILDAKHPITQLIIQSYDAKLHHPGYERVFAELRRKYWILRGREAVKKFQRNCLECQKWRKNPEIPKMADLPPSRLRLFKPAFYSTGMDCFGPYAVKAGRRTEKKWGIIFKCLTTRAVHIDVLHTLDADSFLMALRRFTARRGTPFELISDQGTNFRGGERELREAFAALAPELQAQLAKQQIKFRFNPPNAPHFGGCWEREIRSLKQALTVTIGAQSVTFEVLQTVLVEIEGILNSKPLGYTSSDIADPDPVTPNSLLMGRPDASLPPVIYPESEIISRRRWRHSQVLADHFWKHFLRFYLPNLQTRQKWQADTSDIQVGTTGMIIDPQLPRALWPVGRVSKTFPGMDGRVRTVDIEVGKKTYTRPVARIIRLPSIPE